MDGLDWLDAAPPGEAKAALFRCGGCSGWAAAMTAARPFRTSDFLFEVAEREWSRASREDLLEAFSNHPRIGDRGPLPGGSPGTASWSAAEQSGASGADEAVQDDLARSNREYEDRFGHIFIVCASGKNASEILSLLRARISNEPDAELRIAASEQMKITRLRLERLLGEKAANEKS